MMKKLPLIILILVSCFFQIISQTKKATTITTKKVIPVKTATPTPTAIKSTITPTPTAVKTAPVVNTPANLTGLEAEVLAEINKVRTNPKEYAKIFEEYLKTNSGKIFKIDGTELLTFEGKAPVEEVIALLKQLSPLPEFKAIDGLNKAAKDHAQDLAKNNKSGHQGSDGSMPDTRIARYGIANQINENISYYTKTARRVVMTMLIDDGTSSRNHRKNVLSTNLKVLGIAMGENKEFGNFCVIVFADNFIDKKGGIKSF
ncbi:MAG TPA: CAP domain-containing protein [Pyrinomonadaceae bacterium]|nr:CAP domain-containing protein [Pyrinomonadaceae bacterium]